MNNEANTTVVNTSAGAPAADAQGVLEASLDRAHENALAIVDVCGLDASQVRKKGGPDPRRINVGARPKQHRLEDAILELARDEIRLSAIISNAEAVSRARKRLEVGLDKHVKKTAAAYTQTEPTRIAPRRDGEIDEVKVAAMLDACPNLRYALQDLSSNESDRLAGRSGPKAKRERTVSSLFLMALSMARPDFEDTFLRFRQSPLLRRVFGEPTGPVDHTAALKQLHDILERKDSSYLQHTLVEQFRTIYEARGEDGQLVYPRAGSVVLVDATLMSANIPQRRPIDDADAERMRGARYRDTGFVTYTSKRSAKQEQEPGSDKRVGGIVTTLCHGWKLMALIDQDTGAVMIADKFPADVNERDATLELIERFFELWRDCERFEYLVGDSLYDHGKEFAARLWFGWSIHPVFPEHGNYDKNLPYTQLTGDKPPGVLGVPCCPIHTTHDDGTPRAMKFKDDSDLIGIKQRKRLGIARGVMVVNRSARNRWVCSVPGCKKTATTRFRDDPRVYAHLHRAGDHHRHQLRQALLARRNRVEGFFSSLKNTSLGAQGSMRARWAGDTEMRWLMLLAACGHNARILAELAGSYPNALAHLQALDLTESTADTSPQAQQATGEQRAGHIEPARPPRTWTQRTLDRVPDELTDSMLAA